jgi:hypothetical protein
MDLLLTEDDVVVGLLPFSLLPFLLSYNHGEGLVSVWAERVVNQI